MTDVLKVLTSGDEQAIHDYVDQLENIDCLLNPTRGGDPLTPAWAAAFLGAPTALRILLQRGADVEFSTNNSTVRRLCLIKQQCLPALFEAGLSPNAEELMIWFYSAHETELSAGEIPQLAYNVITETSSPDGGNSILSAEDIQATQAFRDKFSDYFQRVERLKSSRRNPQMNEFLAEMDSSLARVAQELVDHISKALMVLVQNPSVVEAAVRRNFRGYKKNRKWLNDARDRANRDICESLASIYDVFEDTEEFVNLVDTILLRYPVKHVAMGSGQADAPSQNDGRRFETEAYRMLEEEGYFVRRIGGTGDQGADLIAEKNGLSFAIQCKDHSNPVGNAAVQQALAAKVHYKADYAVVCAARGFTKSAKTLGVTTGVLLISPSLLPDLERLRVMVD